MLQDKPLMKVNEPGLPERALQAVEGDMQARRQWEVRLEVSDIVHHFVCLQIHEADSGDVSTRHIAFVTE